MGQEQKLAKTFESYLAQILQIFTKVAVKSYHVFSSYSLSFYRFCIIFISYELNKLKRILDNLLIAAAMF